MKKSKIKFEIGQKVYYHPIIGGSDKIEAVVTEGPYEMCGTTCYMIDAVRGVVDYEALEAR